MTELLYDGCEMLDGQGKIRQSKVHRGPVEEQREADYEARIRADQTQRIAAWLRSPAADDLLCAAEQRPGWYDLTAAVPYTDPRTVLADAVAEKFGGGDHGE